MENLKKNSGLRKTERIRQSFFVHVSKEGAEETAEGASPGITFDVGGGGLSFITEAGYSPGDILRLRIDLLRSRHDLKARVVHVDSQGDSKVVGVAFFDISPSHREELLKEMVIQ